MSVKRFFGPSVAMGIILILSAGIFLRLRDDAGAEETPSGDDLPEVSATEAFSTSVAIPVAGVAVVRDTLVVSVSAAAQAAAWRESRVLAEVDGRIDRITVRENQGVPGGALVVRLDTTDLALAVAEAEAELARADATYRETILFDDQIEDPEIRAERDRVARAKSGLNGAEVGLRRARLALERTEVTAPFAGRIAGIRVAEGHRVRVGDELMTVVAIDPIKVEVQVLESEIGYLAEGRRAQVTFAAFPGESFLGTIETINPVIDRDTRTARVTVTIPNRDGRILPGMYARVSLEARRFPDRVLVPKTAILERDRRTMLFVYEADGASGLAKWTYVTTGLENDSLVELVDDPETNLLEPGQTVLVDGHFTLIHDARVRLTNDPRRESGGRPQ